ncbi:hypothetical protein DFJ74DRAFT_649703 [Hyaloraphidium curvatum]|nr:hypothetical protein DFJ74DRAFT_649703 [Hyaloraphidium curvatum]
MDERRSAMFIEEQDEVWEDVTRELAAGDKRSHWMWFVFPQLRGLGHSRMARTFGIVDLEEARAYLAHPVLGPRLRECVQTVLRVPEDKTARDIFGGIDAVKFRSCLTLFGEAEPGEDTIWRKALDRFYDGQKDPQTLDIVLEGGNGSPKNKD